MDKRAVAFENIFGRPSAGTAHAKSSAAPGSNGNQARRPPPSNHAHMPAHPTLSCPPAPSGSDLPSFNRPVSPPAPLAAFRAPYPASAADAYAPQPQHPQPQAPAPAQAHSACKERLSLVTASGGESGAQTFTPLTSRLPNTPIGTSSTSTSGPASTSALSVASAAAMYQTPSTPWTDPTTEASLQSGPPSRSCVRSGSAQGSIVEWSKDSMQDVTRGIASGIDTVSSFQPRERETESLKTASGSTSVPASTSTSERKPKVLQGEESLPSDKKEGGRSGAPHPHSMEPHIPPNSIKNNVTGPESARDWVGGVPRGPPNPNNEAAVYSSTSQPYLYNYTQSRTFTPWSQEGARPGSGSGSYRTGAASNRSSFAWPGSNPQYSSIPAGKGWDPHMRHVSCQSSDNASLASRLNTVTNQSGGYGQDPPVIGYTGQSPMGNALDSAISHPIGLGSTEYDVESQRRPLSSVANYPSLSNGGGMGVGSNTAATASSDHSLGLHGLSPCALPSTLPRQNTDPSAQRTRGSRQAPFAAMCNNDACAVAPGHQALSASLHAQPPVRSLPQSRRTSQSPQPVHPLGEDFTHSFPHPNLDHKPHSSGIGLYWDQFACKWRHASVDPTGSAPGNAPPASALVSSYSPVQSTVPLSTPSGSGPGSGSGTDPANTPALASGSTSSVQPSDLTHAAAIRPPTPPIPPTSPSAETSLTDTSYGTGLNDAAAAYADLPEMGPTYTAPLPVYAQHNTTSLPLQLVRSKSSRGTSIQSSLYPQTNGGPAEVGSPDDRKKYDRHRPSNSQSTESVMTHMTKELIYPALISHVAKALKESVVVSERSKDGLRYKDAFDGQDAVNKLCHILRTKDRNLALLIGRSLDAQKLFHDVTYDHRLRDSPSEMYQFRVRLAPAGAPQLSYPSDEGNTVTPGDVDGTITSSKAATLLGSAANPDAAANTTGNLIAPGSETTDHDAEPVNRPLPPRTATLLSNTSAGTGSSSFPTPAGENESESNSRFTKPPHGSQRRSSDASHTDYSNTSEGDDFPSGVFTLLTDCYSPTCTPERLCYSITCPRRWEQQQTRFRAQGPGGLSAQPSVPSASLPSLGLVAQGGTSPVRPPQRAATTTSATVAAIAAQAFEDDMDKAPGALWAESVPADILESVPLRERKRQERLNEVVVTERNFVHDLEYMRQEWLIPLRTRSDVIPSDRREEFIMQLFWNVQEILSVNERLCEALVARQKSAYVMDRVGDIFLAFVPRFEPFVRYGAHQLYGKYEFEREKASNPAFAQFVEETERRPAARKLELNGYLTKPVTRLARYPLLLQEVYKYTPTTSPDREDLPRVIDMIKQFLSKVNAETGKSANSFHLAKLDQQLLFKPGEAVDLRLRDPMRELTFKGTLKRRAGPQSESSELQAFLFDHALVITKPKTINKQDFYKVTRKPIPLELLVVTIYDELSVTGKGSQTRVRTTTSKLSTGQRMENVMLTGAPKQDAKQGYALTLTRLGRNGYTLTLWASTYVARQKWMEHIESGQDALRARSNLFSAVPLLSEHFFQSASRRAVCAIPFDFGRRIIYGAHDGVYLSELREKARNPIKVLPLSNVTQVDILEEFQVLIVLADRTLHTFMLDQLDPQDPLGNLKRGRRIQGLVNFFRAGTCLGRTLVCLVKSSPMSNSTIRTLEPVEAQHQHQRGPHALGNQPSYLPPAHNAAFPNAGAGLQQQPNKSKRPALQKLLQGPPGQSEALRVFKEFYVPMESKSVHFLKSKLCIAATKGFEVVDLETLDTQALLDPADPSLDFVFRKENLKPMMIYRIHKEFLLCYDEFAFYVNKTGWRAKGNWLIHWEGQPTNFALHYPYVLAFDPTFIEVHHVGTGALHQVITGSSLKCLFSDITPPLPPGHQAALRALQAQQAQYQLNLQRWAVQKAYPVPQAQAQAPLLAQYQGQPLMRQVAPGGHPAAAAGTVPSLAMRGGLPLSPVPSPGGTHPVPHPKISGIPSSMHSGPAPAYSNPPPPAFVPINSMWESAHASRMHIVFSAGSSIFCIRRVPPPAAAAGPGVVQATHNAVPGQAPSGQVAPVSAVPPQRHSAQIPVAQPLGTQAP